MEDKRLLAKNDAEKYIGGRKDFFYSTALDVLTELILKFGAIENINTDRITYTNLVKWDIKAITMFSLDKEKTNFMINKFFSKPLEPLNVISKEGIKPLVFQTICLELKKEGKKKTVIDLLEQEYKKQNN